MTPLIAAKAYAAAQNGGVSVTRSTGPADGTAFASLVGNAMTQAVQASRAAETQMAAQVQGKAELIDVVTAVSAAEASLETVMAVRDQVISAYQEIMRMPI
jgi:flagellar hook-basal body complex protein FliE